MPLLARFLKVLAHCVANARQRGKQLQGWERFFLAGRRKKPRTKPGNQGVRSGGTGKRTLGDEAMKDTLIAAAMVFFAAIMSFFPSAWEPVSEAEARDLLGKDVGKS